MKHLIDYLREEGIFSTLLEIGLGLFVLITLARCALS